MFDLARLEQDSGLPPAIIKQIEQIVKEDFNDDQMLFELHIVRIFQALKEGRLTVNEVLREHETA
ncbi:MAG: hypothetical protein HZB51_19195 [Chloroflexi bacterium]|nr:hypothetical protein [Chloroflexota bacterium]